MTKCRECEKKCSITNCKSTVYAKGLCNRHYQLQRRLGEYPVKRYLELTEKVRKEMVEAGYKQYER